MARKNKAQLENTNKSVSVIEKETLTTFKHGLWATERDLEMLGHELIEYVRNTPDCFSIEYFLNHKNIHENTFYNWVEKSPDLAGAFERAKQLIFERREKGVLKGELPINGIMPYLWHYSKRYRDDALFKASLNKKEDEKPTQITVVMEPFGKIENKNE